MPSPTVSEGDEDPYAPRSTSQYYYADSDSGASSSSSSRSSSSSSSSSSSRTTASSTPSSSPPTQASSSTANGHAYVSEHREQPVDAEQINEEPLFGESRPRDAHQDGFSGPHRQEEEEEERDSFYALLNVQKDASEEDIREAYRSLAIVLHPDKHTSPSLKTSAENRFRAIQRAYEVLSDPEKRSVYDHFGSQGLTQSWSLVPRSTSGGPRTAAEMREEWEKAARKKRADEIENLIRSKGEFIANIDASSLFCSPERVPRSKQVLQQIGREIAMREKLRGTPIQENEEIEIELPPVAFSERWNRVGLTGLMGKNGWETPITGYTRLLFNGQMVSRNGMGGGNLMGTIRTQWSSKLSLEVTTALMRPRVASFKATYGLNEFSWITFVASTSTLATPPMLNVSFAQRLSRTSTTTGFTSLKSGSYRLGSWGAPGSSSKASRLRQDSPSITVGVTSQSGNGKGWTCQTSLAVENQSISADYAFRPVILGSPKLSVGLTFGTRSGLNAFNSMERKVTENVKIGLGVQVGIPMGGVSFQVRFNRLGQKVTVPIQLAPEYRADLISAFTVIPLASMLAIDHLYLKPLKRKKVANKLSDPRKQNKSLIEERKAAAREAAQVLAEASRKKADQERRRDGLVILQAFYGKKGTWPELRDARLSPDEQYELSWRRLPALSSSLEGGTDEEVEPTSTEDEDAMWCDVRIPVTNLVSKGQLIIPGGRHKSKILGFFDPCMGERKHLIIRYLFRNRLHEAIVDDVTQLAAPLRAHQM